METRRWALMGDVMERKGKEGHSVVEEEQRGAVFGKGMALS